MFSWLGRHNEKIRRLSCNDPSLTCLRLSLDKLRSHEIRSITASLEHNTHLNELYLEGGSLGITLALAFSSSLKSNTSIRILRLVRTRLSANGAWVLFKSIRNSVETLHLEENGLDEIMSRCLRELLEKSDSLKVLTVKRNRVGLVGCRPKSLVELSLEECGECPAICDLIASNKTIERLHLVSTDPSSCLFFNALLQNSTLQELVIVGLVIKDAAGVANVLRKNILHKLCLWGTALGDRGAKALSQGLAENSSLTELRLFGNDIGDTGATALANALVTTSSSINLVDLASNKVSETGAQSLVDALQHIESLETVGLRDNGKISSSLKEEIQYLSWLNKALNKVDRRVLKEDFSLNPALWANILVKVTDDPNLLHVLLKERPDLLQACRTRQEC